MSAPVALVTGASRGIGRQLAVDLAANGYDVVCAARSSGDHPSKLPGTVDETAELVRAKGRRAIAAPLDVRDEEAIRTLADRVFSELGRCDVLVNNAAIAPPKPALQDSTKRWRLAVDINVNGPFYLCYYLCPRMPAGAGRVINVSSGAADHPDFGRPSYTATKLGLEGLTTGLAYELRGKIAVNALRLDVMVWSEGFSETLGDPASAPFEDPVIMTDGVLWLLRQPIEFTGQVVKVTDLRAQGIVRPKTLWNDRAAPR
jgi:NAD(P)-dependent dehydrogenase (short-subunit alcohol dehydrogenase family)